jgi:hypothetical protein
MSKMKQIDDIFQKHKVVLEKINKKGLNLKIDIKEIIKFQERNFSEFNFYELNNILIFIGNYKQEQYLVEIEIDCYSGIRCKKCYIKESKETEDAKKYKKIINDNLIKLNMEELSDEKLKISRKFNKLIKRLKKTNLKPRLISSLKSIYAEDFFQDIEIPKFAFLINDGKAIIFSKIRKNTKCTIIIGIDFWGNYFLFDCFSKNRIRNKNTKNLERKFEKELRKINGFFKPIIKNIAEKIIENFKKKEIFYDGKPGWQAEFFCDYGDFYFSKRKRN